MGHFGKTANATVTLKSGYFPLGKHRVKITKTKVHSGHKGTNVIIEAQCLATDSPQDPRLMPPWHEVLRVGQSRAQVINLGQDMGPINTKAFALAASGFDPTDPEGAEKAEKFWSKKIGAPMSFEEVLDALFDESLGLLDGLEMDLECINTKTKAGKDFTVHKWSPAVWTE